MKRLITIAILLLPLLTRAQLPDSVFTTAFEQHAFKAFTEDSSLESQLALFLASNPEMTEEKFQAIYKHLLTFNKRNRLDRSSKLLFNTVQDSFLRHYDANSTMSHVFNDTLYSCVTGSAIIAFFLDLNDFEYAIEEMPNHVFLKVQHKGKTFIAESTDPKFGFLRDNRMNRRPYTPDTLDNNYVFQMISSYSGFDQNGLTIKSEVRLYELAGLNYYNEAVKSLNAKNYADAALSLKKAYYLYPSKRVAEMYKYCLIKLIYNHDLDLETRQLYHQQLANLLYPLSMN